MILLGLSILNQIENGPDGIHRPDLVHREGAAGPQEVATIPGKDSGSDRLTDQQRKTP